MRILVADETNTEQQENVKFFLYGGVIFDTTSIKVIGDSIKDIREHYGIEDKEKIKFNLRSCPEKISREQHTEIKNRIIELAIENNVSVIINCVLHDIAKNKERSELMEMTSSTVFRRFNKYCYENNSPGLVLSDQWPTQNGFSFLESTHFGGITYRNGVNVKLPWIYGYGQISDNSTSLMSMADIVLGAFRYCINERDKTVVNRNLMPKIARLMWHREENGKIYIKNRGLTISPNEIKVDKYRQECDALVEHILEYANSSEND